MRMRDLRNARHNNTTFTLLVKFYIGIFLKSIYELYNEQDNETAIQKEFNYL